MTEQETLEAPVPGASGTDAKQPAAPAIPPIDRDATVYVLLLNSGPMTWEVAAPAIAAKSAEAAIRHHVEKLELKQPLTFIAVPERSWKPTRVSAKVTTTLVVEEA